MFSWGTGKKSPPQEKKKQVNINDYSFLLAVCPSANHTTTLSYFIYDCCEYKTIDEKTLYNVCMNKCKFINMCKIEGKC